MSKKFKLFLMACCFGFVAQGNAAGKVCFAVDPMEKAGECVGKCVQQDVLAKKNDIVADIMKLEKQPNAQGFAPLETMGVSLIKCMEGCFADIEKAFSVEK